uniref:Small ribosomal subunit protein uS14 n=1 Tax=Salmo trutta TaxID=8032 RepID=A0A674B0J8_SALTR
MFPALHCGRKTPGRTFLLAHARVCSNRHGLIRKYGLNMCRQCFRQYANDIGFVKASICHSRFSRTQWTPSFLNGRSWNHQDSSWGWPPGQTEQLGEKGLGQGGDQEPNAPEFIPLWRWENFPEG